MKKVIITVVGFSFITILLISLGMYVSYNNEDVGLRAAISSKVKVNQSSYTKMWEILTQKAGVTQKYSADFKEIYPKLIEGRYSNGGGQMMQWIQEHNPNFDTGLYKDLMNSIEAQRESFHTNQEQLQDLSRQHNTLIKSIPAKWFLSNLTPIKVPTVINSQTEKAFSTGKEQKMNLFE